MAAFVAKQMMGSKLNAVKARRRRKKLLRAIRYVLLRRRMRHSKRWLSRRSRKGQIGGGVSSGGDGEAAGEDREAAAEEEQERLEALREAEERRKEKHRKMEEEREKMRQSIRDKYGIKKKEEAEEEIVIVEGTSLNRKKKTPAEIEAEAEEVDDFTRWKNTIEAQLGELKQTIESKCLLQ